MKQVYSYISIVVCAIILSACLSEKAGPDLSRQECYQIRNESSTAISLQFYHEASPKIVYIETWSGDFKTDMTTPPAAKSIDKLRSDSCITLSEGQTALFYLYKLSPNWPDTTAYGLISIGNGQQIHFFNHISSVIGDSVVLSAEGRKDSFFRMNNYEIWETWYNEKQYVYYHFWRIE